MFDDHDPLCPFSNGANGPVRGCQCGLIAEVRADERRRVADRVRIPRDVATNDPDPWVPLADVLGLIDGGKDG